MENYDYLRNYFNSLSPLSEEEWLFIKSRFKTLVLKKNEFLLTPQKVCPVICFNRDGVFRMYALDHKGNEKNYFFQLEYSFITDYDSFLHQKPSNYYIECLQDAHLTALDYQSVESIFQNIPPFQKIGRLVAEMLYVKAKNRVEDFMFLSAEERYFKLISQHPEIFQKIPLQYIAEYINVRPQSLSRIRKRVARNN